MDDKDPRLESERAVRRSEKHIRGRVRESNWDSVPGVQAPDLPATSLPVREPAPASSTPSATPVSNRLRNDALSRSESASVGPRVDDTPGEDAEQIRRLSEIAETHHQMSKTIDAITDRLSPATIATNAGEKAREAAGRAVQAISDSEPVRHVRDRPMGAILAAAGVGSLFLVAGMRQRRGPRRPVASEYQPEWGAYDDLTSTDTPRAGIADETGDVVFAEGVGGTRAVQSPRVTRRRWPWLLGAVALGAVGALALRAVADAAAEATFLKIEESDTVIPLEDPVVGD